MGAPTEASRKARTHNFATVRHKFTKREIRLLLAGDYHGYVRLTGKALSTARRYGHIVRHAQDNGVTIIAAGNSMGGK